MSVLLSSFHHGVPISCPVTDDYLLVRHQGDDGEVISEPEKVDYVSILVQNGTADIWKLPNLLAAGIRPETLKVHTGSTTRSADYDKIDGIFADLPEKQSEIIETKIEK